VRAIISSIYLKGRSELRPLGNTRVFMTEIPTDSRTEEQSDPYVHVLPFLRKGNIQTVIIVSFILMHFL